MKILFWSSCFWPRVGGTEVQALKFIEGMQSKGHLYHAIAQRDHEKIPEEEIYQGISIKRFDFRRIIAQNDLKQISLIKNHLKFLQKEGCLDLIHVYSGSPEDLFILYILQRGLAVPIILTIQGSWGTGNNYVLPLTPSFLPMFRRVCCISQWIMHQAEQQVPDAKDKLQLIYNGLPLVDLPPFPLSFSPPTLFVYGRHVVEKGFDTAIRAFSLLKKSGSSARLIIGGDGPLCAELQELVKTLGLHAAITFTGTLSQSQVFAYLNQATLVLVPSTMEPFGLVLLEAMQMQRPVIASRIGGMQEILVDQETGLFVPPGDPNALFLAIQDLLDHPNKAIQMGQEGGKRALAFSLEKILTQYEALYQEVCRT